MKKKQIAEAIAVMDYVAPEPVYMVVPLTAISKASYNAGRKFATVAKPSGYPIGYIMKGEGGSRHLYISSGGYYVGKLNPSYTDEMFMNWKTRGVEVTTKIVFTKVQS